MKLSSVFNPRSWFGSAPSLAAANPVSNAQNRRMLQARFDSQFTTDENKEHWKLADAMSIDASASWTVRRTLRMRSRYEYHNNSYYFGIADTIGNYVVGTGPRLQMLTKNKGLNAAIEKLWSEWAAEIRLGEKLKSMRVARLVNGESFSVLRTNPALDCPVKLDVFEVECDQVSSPLFGMYPAQYPDQFFDGLILDKWGNPQTYHILRQHPGAFGAFVMLGYEFDAYPASVVLHDFKRIRPGQQRGIPEALAALPLFSQLRRYNLAVLGAAETAADYAMVIKTDAAPDPDATDSPDPMDTFQLRARMATVMPQGWEMQQTRAEQPTTTHDQFTTTLLREIARCLNLPVVFATLDASLANMSSAYIVTQPFAMSVASDREGYARLLNRILDQFLTETLLIPGLLPSDLPNEFPHHWMWPAIGNHADPMKVAAAQQIELGNGTTTIPREFAKRGLDWEEEQTQAAESMGVTLDEYRAGIWLKTIGVPTANGKPAADPKADPKPEDDIEETSPQPADTDA